MTEEVTEETTEESTPSYYLSEGVGGEGDAPEWYKADKYKSVADQAKAYTDLESRFGSFTGAPDEYTIEAPEGIQLAESDPLLDSVKGWAKENNLSQDGLNGLVGSFFQNQIAQDAAAQELAAAEMAKLDNADQRVTDINDFLKANIPDGYDEIADIVSTAKGVEAIESLIKMAAAKPTISDGTPSGAATQEGLEKLMSEKDDNGRVIYKHDPKRRAEVAAYIARM